MKVHLATDHAGLELKEKKVVPSAVLYHDRSYQKKKKKPLKSFHRQRLNVLVETIINSPQSLKQ